MFSKCISSPTVFIEWRQKRQNFPFLPHKKKEEKPIWSYKKHSSWELKSDIHWDKQTAHTIIFRPFPTSSTTHTSPHGPLSTLLLRLSLVVAHSHHRIFQGPNHITWSSLVALTLGSYRLHLLSTCSHLYAGSVTAYTSKPKFSCFWVKRIARPVFRPTA